MDMTEYESERERVAMITDLRLEFQDLQASGKDSLTVDEVIGMLDKVARRIKTHKYTHQN